jgi:cation transport ATPase
LQFDFIHMKYIALVLALLFTLFAAWQYNDPDPLWWTTLYGVVVYACQQAFRDRYNLEMLMVLAILYAAGAVNIGLQMSGWEGFFSEGAGLAMKTNNQELAREASGLAICCLTLSGLAVFAYFRKRR